MIPLRSRADGTPDSRAGEVGPGPHPGFRWNAGGWFGAQLGSTAWILIAGVLVWQRDIWTGSLALACFLAANVFGTLLWIGRCRFRPYPAIQVLIVVVGLAGLAATWLLDRAGHFESLGAGAETSARSMYMILAFMVPGLLILFYLIERNSRSADD